VEERQEERQEEPNITLAQLLAAAPVPVPEPVPVPVAAVEFAPAVELAPAEEQNLPAGRTLDFSCRVCSRDCDGNLWAEYCGGTLHVCSMGCKRDVQDMLRGM